MIGSEFGSNLRKVVIQLLTVPAPIIFGELPQDVAKTSSRYYEVHHCIAPNELTRKRNFLMDHSRRGAEPCLETCPEAQLLGIGKKWERCSEMHQLRLFAVYIRCKKQILPVSPSRVSFYLFVLAKKKLASSRFISSAARLLRVSYVK